MHNIKNRLDIINEILRKLPEGTGPNFIEKNEYIFIMCEKLGMCLSFNVLSFYQIFHINVTIFFLHS